MTPPRRSSPGSRECSTSETFRPGGLMPGRRAARPAPLLPWRDRQGSPQLAAGGQGHGGTGLAALAGGQRPGGKGLAALAPFQLSGSIAEAVARWAATGLSAADVARLRAVTVEVTDLPDGDFGAAPLYGTVISLDDDAAGYGWFV